jgi:hypothetical protein
LFEAIAQGAVIGVIQPAARLARLRQGCKTTLPQVSESVRKPVDDSNRWIALAAASMLASLRPRAAFKCLR